jgi:hypothetical protein
MDARPRAMNLARAAACALLGLGSVACGDDPELVIVVAHPTLVQVSPAEFLGMVPCLPAEGAMQRYVATIYDVTPELSEDGAAGAGGAGGAPEAGPRENFALPSSGPTPCTQTTASAFVVNGRRYAAEIDGYDRTDIQPLAAGARVMLDSETGETVEPRWTSTCGREPGESVMAVYQTTQTVSHCAKLEDDSPSDAAPTVTVSLEGALGDLECGTDPGQIARFEVLDTQSGETVEADCGDVATLTGFTSGTVLELQVLAYESGVDSPSFGTLCSAMPLTGIVLAAVCQPLIDEGALDIDLLQALDSVELTCEQASVREVIADPGDDRPVTQVVPPRCNNTLRLGDLPPGDTSISLSTTRANGESGPTLTCSGTVLPGLSTPAECTPD